MTEFELQLRKTDLSAFWDSYDWRVAEEELFSMQAAIVSCVHCRDKSMIISSQQELLRSLSARMLAVRHVSDTATSPGIDGVRWNKSNQKMKAALDLNRREYKAKPCRLLVVQPKKGKERNVKLSTMYDRAMQTLHSYALIPVAETLGDRKSFAFRPYRSAMDAHFYVLKAFTGEDAPKYAVKADIKACYESISHRWLLRNIPMNKTIFSEFLQAGHIFDGELFPPMEYGISIGSSLSPVLANMTMDGLQNAIYQGLHKFSIDHANGDMIRFADDVIVAANTVESARKILDIMIKFLRPRGLTLSPTKTKIVSVNDGFDFISRHYQKIDGMVYSRPSDSAVAKFEQSLVELISKHNGSQQSLIEELNKKINGWVGYHKYADASDAFRHLDAVINSQLLELCERKHKRMEQKNIIKRYFIRDADGEYVYSMKDKRGVRVNRLAKTPYGCSYALEPKPQPIFGAGVFQTSFGREGSIEYCG